MAGCYRDTAAHAQMRSGEIDFFRAAQADVLHRDALLSQPFNQRRFDRLTGEADVMSDNYGAGLNDVGVSTANSSGDILVELIRDPPPNIVGLETR